MYFFNTLGAILPSENCIFVSHIQTTRSLKIQIIFMQLKNVHGNCILLRIHGYSDATVTQQCNSASEIVRHSSEFGRHYLFHLGGYSVLLETVIAIMISLALL